MHLPQEVAENTDRQYATPEQALANPQAVTATGDAGSRVPGRPASAVPGYEILGELGRGSMGVVYKARQKGLQRLVALKMILADAHVGPEKLQRFVTEARVVAALQHPNIVQIYEVNFQRDVPYFSMELVEGGTLADRLGGRPQPFREAAELILTLARAIHVAHQQGIVHRDLKPGNILIKPPESSEPSVQRLSRALGLPPQGLGLGTPKIVDFGLAKELYADVSDTESGAILGTPSYMAPEQAEGKSRDVGPSADIYALGAILYEMLTGRPPFTAESPLETVLLLFQTEPISPSRLAPRIPRDLETICLKCLQKVPRCRYASAEELADDLGRFLAGEPILARPAPRHQKVWKWMRRRPALATLAAGSALTLPGLLGLILWHQLDLHTRLGQALDDEREARAEQETVSERERLGQLRDRIKDLVHAGEAALASHDWHDAQLQLTRARDQAADEVELAELRDHIMQLQRQSDRQRLDHERLDKFLRLRNEALFQATRFTGGNLSSILQETRQAACDALALFGVTLDAPLPSPPTAGGPSRRRELALDSPYYTERQKTEIVVACYELLVVLADAVAQPLPEQRDVDQRRQGEEAVRILDHAARLGVTTQAYYRRRAQYLAQAGQAAAADQERVRAVALHPSTALDHFLLGQELYRQGNCQQAILAFENVLQGEPGHFWASYYLALCWLKTQRPDRATACLTACLVQRRDFPWLYLLRASAWGELGQLDRAEADFEAALQAPLSDADRYGLFMNRGVLRIRQGRLDSAMADLQQAIALRPEQYQGYVNLAQAHLQNEELDNALGQLDQAIRREPGLASLYRTRARIHLLREDQAAALADLGRAIELEPAPTIAGVREPGLETGPGAGGVLAGDYLERGRILYDEKDYPRALEAFDAALRLRPRDARVCRLRAEALLALNRFPEALQSLDDCLKQGPPDAGAFRARAVLRTRLGQYAGAQTDYTRALELEPDAATYAARGWCYLVADAGRLALPDFEEAIRLAPDDGAAYAGRGYCRALAGEPQPAVADAQRALRCGPRSPRLHCNVARVYAQAIAALDSQAVGPSVTIDALRGDWQQRALRLLAEALDMQPPAEAARLWQDVIQTDKALNPIRRAPGFRQLAARFPAR